MDRRRPAAAPAPVQGRDAYVLAEGDAFSALLDALARRIAAAGDPPAQLLGIRRRGVPLARELARRLAGPAGAPPVHELGLHRYADDLTLLHPETALEHEPGGLQLRGERVLVVDDVLYTGRTLLRATTWLLARGASRIETAVLCRREGLEVPVAADFVGLQLEVGAATVIEVRMPPFEPAPQLALVRRPA